MNGSRYSAAERAWHYLPRDVAWSYFVPTRIRQRNFDPISVRYIMCSYWLYCHHTAGRRQVVTMKRFMAFAARIETDKCHIEGHADGGRRHAPFESLPRLRSCNRIAIRS